VRIEPGGGRGTGRVAGKFGVDASAKETTIGVQSLAGW